MRLHMASSVLVVVGVLGMGRPAHADPVVLSFSGQVTSVHPDLASAFAVGASLSGTLQLDLDGASHLVLDPRQDIYFSSAQPLVGQIGDYAFSGNGRVQTLDDDPGGMRYGSQDWWVFDAFNSSPTLISLQGPDVNGLMLRQFQLALIDQPDATGTTAGVFTVPVLTDFSSTTFALYFDGDRVVSGSVDALAPVPEPATVVLIGGGLAGIFARRWQSRRRH